MPRFNGYATFSDDGVYRYELGGDIGPVEPLLSVTRQVKLILWIMLNPSTADGIDDDPTIRTIVTFSELWGYNRLIVGNLYAYRATRTRDLFKAMNASTYVVGPGNDRRLARMVERVRVADGRVMAAWGRGGTPRRAQEVHALAGEMWCLKTNNDGSPVHPLYQPHSLVPTVWKGMPT